MILARWNVCDVRVSRYASPPAFRFHAPSVFLYHQPDHAGFFWSFGAAGGYYIKNYGGDWGTILADSTDFYGNYCFVVTVFVSESTRTRLSVLVDKHFFHHKYDYRVEWLKLINYLSELPMTISTSVH